ncbi:MAG: hypothetical protein IPL50_17040 [Chitinophagaceae bacterium]|nr:hypothetical protein [Chitinophagaceae bacterium]
MKSNRPFDEHIKEQFGNYAPDVHPRIWENIIAEKDKKRPAGFWVSMFNGRQKLLFIGLIIALTSGGAWIFFNRHIIKEPSNNIAENKKNNSIPVNKNSITEFTQTDNKQPGNDPVKADHLLTADNNTPNSKPAYISDGSIKAGIYAPGLQTDEDNSIPGDANDRNKKIYAGLGNVLIKTTSPELAEDEFEGTGTLLGRLSFLAEKYTVKRKTGKPGTVHFNPVIFLPDCPIEKDAAGNKKYFEFYAGPDYAIRSLHDTGNSAYLQKRKESTRFRSGYSAGLRYTKVFNNSMSVRGGVNFSQINEKFTFNEGNIIQVTYIINSNGDTIGSYSTTGTRYKTTINRYRSIDIPLVVGYELGNGRLHANINAGAIINVYSWQNGDVLDTAGNPVSITTGKGSSPYQFKTNAGVGFIGAVSVYYKLNDRLHLLAEPYFRYTFSPMNKENITLKQKYQTAGLRFGIRLDLK